MDESLALHGSPAPKRRTKFLVGGGVILVVLVVLVAWAMSRAGATAFYMTTSELVELGPTKPGETVGVNGKVTPGSIERDGLATTFEISDGHAAVEITTEEGLPDAFRSGAEVVARGTFDGTTFSAVEVVAKCPSKFKPASD